MKTAIYAFISASAIALVASGCTGSPPAQASSEFDVNDQPAVMQDAESAPVEQTAGGGFGGGRGGPLVMREDVQAELGLSEEQIVEIAGLMRESEGQEPGDGASSWEDVMDDGQRARYRELSLQRAGLRALVWDDVADELGLSDDQITAIEDALEAGRPQRGEGGFDRDAFIKLRDEMNEKIMDVLTDAQKAKWEQMLGETFEFQRQRRGAGAAGNMTPL